MFENHPFENPPLPWTLMYLIYMESRTCMFMYIKMDLLSITSWVGTRASAPQAALPAATVELGQGDGSKGAGLCLCYSCFRIIFSGA